MLFLEYKEAVEIGTSKQAQGDTDLVSTAVKLLVYEGTTHGLLKKHFLLLLPCFNVLPHPDETPAGHCRTPCCALLPCSVWLGVPPGVFLRPPPLVPCHLGLAARAWGRCHQGHKQGSGDTHRKPARAGPGKCSAGIVPPVLHPAWHTFYRKKRLGNKFGNTVENGLKLLWNYFFLNLAACKARLLLSHRN